MSENTSTSTTELPAIVEQASSYALETLSRVTASDLDLPTPCTDWDVRAVVDHIADVADAIIDFTTTGVLAMPAPHREETSSPVAGARQRIDALHDALSALGDHPEQVERHMRAAQAGATELATHAWDISTALDLGRPIPDSTASALLTLIEGNLDDESRADAFAPAVPATAYSTPNDLFLAYLGRNPAGRRGENASASDT